MIGSPSAIMRSSGLRLGLPWGRRKMTWTQASWCRRGVQGEYNESRELQFPLTSQTSVHPYRELLEHKTAISVSEEPVQLHPVELDASVHLILHTGQAPITLEWKNVEGKKTKWYQEHMILNWSKSYTSDKEHTDPSRLQNIVSSTDTNYVVIINYLTPLQLRFNSNTVSMLSFPQTSLQQFGGETARMTDHLNVSLAVSI